MRTEASQRTTPMALLLCIGLFAAFAGPARAQGSGVASQLGQAAVPEEHPATCPKPGEAIADVKAVYKYEKKAPQNQNVATARIHDVQLGDDIAVEVEHLGDWDRAVRACAPAKAIVLFLDGREVKKATAYPVTNPKEGVLIFELKRTEDSRDVWARLLGSPSWSRRPVSVSVGMEDSYALASGSPTDSVINLSVIPHAWFAFWFVLLLILFMAFLTLAYKTNLIRDSITQPATAAARPFSLARTQMAWWFFIIVAAYLFIGLITGDFATSVTSQVLVLLGISAATMVGGAVVDAQKSSTTVSQSAALTMQTLDAAVTQADQKIAQLEKQLGDLSLQANTAQAQIAATNQQLADLTAERDAKKSQLQKLQVVSESFLTDILSDYSGITFHRFQIAAWTVVLGIIFVLDVYKSLAMPTFDSTLLSLIGISAGTYIGLKIPEPAGP